MPKTNESRLPIFVVRNCPPPPHIRRAISSELEKHEQENDPLHPLYEQDPARKRLKSRYSFLHSVRPDDGRVGIRRMTLWSRHHHTISHSVPMNRCLQVRVRHGPMVKPKSPPGRDWTMQIPYAEMGIQRGQTDNVRMCG